MRKNKKGIVSYLVALSVITSISFSIPVDVQAKTLDSLTNNNISADSNGTSVEVTKDNLNEIPNILERTTVTGGGGSATVDPYSNSVYWKVKPATKWPYEFKGTLEIAYYNGKSQYFNLSGFGALGTSVSDTVELSGSGGYYVYLNGAAYSLDGNKYTVLPGCEAGYGY